MFRLWFHHGQLATGWHAKVIFVVVLQGDPRCMSRFRDGMGNVGGYLRDIDDITNDVDMSDFVSKRFSKFIFEIALCGELSEMER